MVYEYTSAPNELKCFTAEERLRFKEHRESPANVWIWVGRYDGPRWIHAVQRRAVAQGAAIPTIYSFTLTASYLAIQVFTYRYRVGDLASLAQATTSGFLTPIWPAAGITRSWPPVQTIDDSGLAVLDDRFTNAISRR